MNQNSLDTLFKPSVIGKVYNDLSEAFLIGKYLLSFELEKTNNIVKSYDFEGWNTQIKPYEISSLFYVACVLESLGYQKLAADMIQFILLIIS